jgi:hypothetical protein
MEAALENAAYTKGKRIALSFMERATLSRSLAWLTGSDG